MEPARVPGANDKVLVGSGTNVTYDAVSDASLDCVSVEGALRFRNNANTRIKVGNLMVKDGGTLEVGTGAVRFPPASSPKSSSRTAARHQFTIRNSSARVSSALVA